MRNSPSTKLSDTLAPQETAQRFLDLAILDRLIRIHALRSTLLLRSRPTLACEKASYATRNGIDRSMVRRRTLTQAVLPRRIRRTPDAVRSGRLILSRIVYLPRIAYSAATTALHQCLLLVPLLLLNQGTFDASEVFHSSVDEFLLFGRVLEGQKHFADLGLRFDVRAGAGMTEMREAAETAVFDTGNL